jgi:hypothetical protein
MRPVLLLALVAMSASVPAGAQSVILPATGAATGPNAQAAQRPLGPNARIAHRTTGPNTALARKASAEVHYPSCAAAGTVRTTPIRRGDPGYGRHLDHDGDGVACE